MIPALQPYSQMKDSGADWFGKIPEHWGVRRLRTVSEMRVSNVDKHSKEGEVPVRLCNYVDVYYHGRIRPEMAFLKATATPEEIQRFRLQRNDVLITKDSETWDDIGVPALVEDGESDLLSGYHLALLRPHIHLMAGGYLFRALQSPGVAGQLHVSANGVTRYGLSHSGIKATLVPLPPVAEQTAIARFLDHMDRRIKKYIRAKEKLIALLDEYKQALIHQAVTGQIDVRTGKPYAAYKPSGLDWLGDVPANWDVVRNGQLFAQRNEVGFSDLPILEVSLRSGVRVRDFEDSHRKQVMSDRSMYKRVVAGDIAYNTMRMWQGAVGVAPVDGLVSPAYVVARPTSGTAPRFFDHLFHTHPYMLEVNRHSRGIVKDRNRLYWEDFKQIANPCPPYAEQALIADAVDRNVSSVVESVRRVREQIGLAKEYCARLVADVVTGKLDVRSAGGGSADVPASKRSRDRMVGHG